MGLSVSRSQAECDIFFMLNQEGNYNFLVSMRGEQRLIAGVSIENVSPKLLVNKDIINCLR